MPKPSSSADRIRKSHPELWQRFTALADACHEAGPLDEKTRRLIKLALAIAAGTEGGTHSAVRHAKESGITLQEMEHVVMLSITTLGFPAAGRALAWIHDSATQSATTSAHNGIGGS
jgi:alkylhydroperoxidase/carboxymuconolactone decarboxylase family protein YurZ